MKWTENDAVVRVVLCIGILHQIVSQAGNLDRELCFVSQNDCSLSRNAKKHTHEISAVKFVTKKLICIRSMRPNDPDF